MSNFHFLSSALMFFHCFMVTYAVTTRNLTTDQSVLLEFKHQINDPYGILIDNWTTSHSFCNWIGVTCGARHNRIVALNLPNMNLTGTIPPELGNLSFLASLNLSGNGFHGDLPGELGHLSRLKLVDLSFNFFTGKIPSSFGRLNQVSDLVLSNNNLTGAIPHEISNLLNMRTLDLASNKLYGPIPSSIYNISSLRKISLSLNSLSGKIPDDMCHHLPNLEALYLGTNELSGQIPATIDECRNLQGLLLDYNQLSGSIPRRIGNLTALTELYLGGNNLEGEIPWEIGNLLNLEIFFAVDMRLTGLIPTSIGNLTKLREIYLGPNFLEGEIPWEIGNIHSLEIFSAPNMSLNGEIPHSILNGSSLKAIYVMLNHLSGKLPDIRSDSNLEELHLWGNNLSGNIPESISNVSKLRNIALMANSFSGHIPNSLGNLKFLEELRLWKNNLTIETNSNGEWSFFASLLNCKYLKVLDLSVNPLKGVLPTSISNLSQTLQFFACGDCRIEGTIPMEIGSLNNAIILELTNNELIGSIPTTIGGLTNLQYLGLSGNKLQGSIPHDLCGLKGLYELSLDDNELDGPLPPCLGELTSMRKLHLSFNKLHSSIPFSLWSLKDILKVDLSSNYFNGSLPLEIGKLSVLQHLDLSMNSLSNDIPSTIGNLRDLQVLALSSNRFHGLIPTSISDLVSLESLDLSENNLSGVIPKSLEGLRHLKKFNVSLNRLEGEIPSGGPFANFTSQSFMKNYALCGSPRLQVSPCKSNSHRNSKKTLLHVLRYVLPIVASIIIVITLIFVCTPFKKKRKSTNSTTIEDSFPLKEWKRISYDQLSKATDGFSGGNMLGSGSFGTVYKGILFDETEVAIKVFNLQLEGAFRSFDVECEVMSKIIHRNLVKVITCCSSTTDFKALVLELMPNGSLDKWLYSNNHFLDILQRINIMIDVASALEYLHSGYSTPLIHCDLKPSNVLLDKDMIAHVGDFGIAKLLGEGDSMKQTMTLATIGYMAPEYGSAGIISVKSDVYSYGILLMETFTRKKPTDEIFAGEMSMKHWVKTSLGNGIIGAGDSGLLEEDDKYFVVKANCISSIMKLALDCSAELPEDRTDMNNVLSILKNIKRKFINDIEDD
ncbi:hypothetical protein ES288_A05G318500v1 [Gossypium darwinii]|uniref:non-specific serine/threonine protein kinase n=1 Tax=Gossypium darwinii TaxID=34276 RepID=A0A5D2GN93_GOSDA|nr:hypothetical protein ES288_A05G318500v1 [Gossypium darwinii]TYH19008.1 hypothetical protein ES288_A05G318500v1 [Gossypium darwinii]